MITHIVLFKLKDRSEETINRTAQMLRDLDGKIDELLFLEVGTDVLHSERSFDVALTATFQDMEGLQAYQVHPEHKKVIEYINTVKDVSISVDYES